MAGCPLVDMMTKRSIVTNQLAGFNIAKMSSADLIEYCLEHIQSKHQLLLFFANTNLIVKCQNLLSLINKSPVLIVNDGVGVDLAAMITGQEKFPANLNGTDFHNNLALGSPRPLRMFLLGAAPGVAQRAAKHFEGLNQVIVGALDGFQGIAQANIIDIINDANADVLMVAMGNPKQEEWILRYAPQMNVSLITGVGALFDFYSGDRQRAPEWVQSIRMEWFYRLLQEPQRLLKRYTVDIIYFLFICLKYKLRVK